MSEEERKGPDIQIIYEFGKLLGSGSCADTYEVIRKDTGKVYAAKVSRGNFEKMKMEAEIL